MLLLVVFCLVSRVFHDEHHVDKSAKFCLPFIYKKSSSS